MIRCATPDDSSSICRVHMESIRVLAKDHYSAAQIEAWCGNRVPKNYLRPLAEQVMFVAEIAGEVVGFGQLSVEKASVEAVYVHPQYARQGVGTELLQALEASAIAAGVPDLMLQASLNAVAFYAAAGYLPSLLSQHMVAGSISVPCMNMSRTLR